MALEKWRNLLVGFFIVIDAIWLVLWGIKHELIPIGFYVMEGKATQWRTSECSLDALKRNIVVISMHVWPVTL